MSRSVTRIAIVDDEPKICDLLREVLVDEGYGVDTFSYSLDCLAAVSEGQYDLLISDLKMPVLDGLALAARARKAHKDLVVVLITGYASVESAVEALRSGIDDYLTKPLEIDEIKAVVERALSRREMKHRNERLLAQLKTANRELVRARENLSRQIHRATDHLNRTNTSLERRVNELSLLNDMSKLFSSIVDIERLLDVYIDLVCHRIGIRNCAILLTDDTTGDLVVCAAQGDSARGILGERIGRGMGVEGFVAQNRIPVLIDDLAADSRFRGKHSARYERGTFICAPLVVKGEVLGVIDLNQKTTGDRFTEDDLNLLSTIAGQISVAIDNARLYRIMQENSFRTVQALATTLEAKDRYTHGHSSRVTDYAMKTAEAMSLSGDELESLRYASQLHDVGKIGVEEAILRKPATLTVDERRAIQEHPVIGERIIEPLDFLNEVRTLIRNHHERWDGKGYPDGLKGDDIPLLTQIMAVADAYDAMTSERPYRGPKSRDEAVRELRRCSGTQFSPRVVEAFISVLSENVPVAG